MMIEPWKYTDSEIEKKDDIGQDDIKRILAIRSQIRNGGSIFEAKSESPNENIDIIVKYESVCKYMHVLDEEPHFSYGLFYLKDNTLINSNGRGQFSNLNCSFIAIDWKYAVSLEDQFTALFLSSDMPEFDVAQNSIKIRKSRQGSSYATSMSDFWSVSFKDELKTYMKENQIRMGIEGDLGKRTIQFADIFTELSSAYSGGKTPDFFEQQINVYDYVFSFKSPVRVKLRDQGVKFLVENKIDIPVEDKVGYVSWVLIDLIKVFSPLFEQSIFSKPFEDTIFID
jgi:hypothetical protein